MHWHYNVLKEFNNRIYSNCVTSTMLREEKVFDGQPFWYFEKDKKKYLMSPELIDKLPFIIRETQSVSKGERRFHIVTRISPAIFKPERYMSFRELVDSFCDFKHSNPRHFLMYRIMGLAGYIGRLNVRVASRPSFGKDSILNALSLLRNDVSITNPSSTAAVEYRLINKILALNELSNLDAKQRRILQELLLLVGDFSNKYEKSTRGSKEHGTFDTYDITNLSLFILFNDVDAYAPSGQENKYFDLLFQQAVLDRYIPFKFDGELNVQQFQNNIHQTDDEFFKRTIRTMEWYRENYESELKDWVCPVHIKGRHGYSFNVLQKFVNLYSNDEMEYLMLINDFARCYKSYCDMIKELRGDDVKEGLNKFINIEDSNVVITDERIKKIKEMVNRNEK